MKKIMYILIFIVFCTGCSATYNIDIYNGTVDEKLFVKETNTNLFDININGQNTMRNLFKSISVDDEFYKSTATLEHIDTKKTIGLKYNNKFKLNEYDSKSIIAQCYENPTIQITDKNISIESGTEFSCFDNYEYLDNLKIILKTNHVVLSNNADQVNNNTYIWNVNKSNYNDKSINIRLDINKYKKDYTYIAIIIGTISFIIILGLIIINIIMKKMKKRNSF